ncbi:hypothetical protein CTR22_004395 [Salmonella enterica subsp. houtenae]|nr:hypothetical protein [Salmonella enterica subsp. houtenae]
MIIPPGVNHIGPASGLDPWKGVSINNIAANGRPFGSGFTVSADKIAFVTYSIDMNIPSKSGGKATITASVDGKFVAGSRNTEIVSSGDEVSIQRREVFSFFVPAGGAVTLGRSLSPGVSVALAGGQEVIF